MATPNYQFTEIEGTAKIDIETGVNVPLGQIDAVIKNVSNTLTSEVNELETTLNEEISDLTENMNEHFKALDLANVVNVLNPRIVMRNVEEYSYLASNPPTGMGFWAIQGGCFGKGGRYAALFSTGLVYYRQHDTDYLNTVVLKEFNADGSVYRQSSPIKAGHGNCLCYVPTTDEYLIGNNYQLTGDTSETRVTSSVVTRVSGSTLAKIADVSYSNLGTSASTATITSLSYDVDTDTVYMANTDDWLACYINPVTMAITGNIFSIDVFAEYYQSTLNEIGTSRRQMSFHSANYIGMMFYMPNSIVLAERLEDGTVGDVVKVLYFKDRYFSEIEFIDLKANGDYVIGMHKRYYNRTSETNTGQEVVSNIATILVGNIETDSLHGEWEEGTAVSAYRYIDINPSTTSTIQNGSPNHPCKSFMEAFYIYEMSENRSSLAFRVPSTASGTITWARVSGEHITIVDNSNESVIWANNMRFTDCYANIQGIRIGSYSSLGRVPYPFYANANVSFSLCLLFIYEWTRSVYTSTEIGVTNCVTIGTTNVSDGVKFYNHNLKNLPA